MVKCCIFGGHPTDIVRQYGGTVAAFDKSLHYVSPSKFRKARVNFRSAIYSLGCTMLVPFDRRPAFAGKRIDGNATATAEGEIRAVPRKVRRLLAQVLSSNPAAPPSDPLEFYGKLQECLVLSNDHEARSRHR